MNCLSQVSSAIFRTTGRSVVTGALYAGLKLINFESTLSRFRTQLYSSQSKGSKATSSRPRKKRVMDPEKDSFYVVRKGDVVGVYKNLADCQAQQGSSICDPPVSVYKGYSMPKHDEQYLASYGLQNALFTISILDMKDNLFGKLVDCSLQDTLVRTEPLIILFPDPSSCKGPTSSKGETAVKNASKKRSHQESQSENVEVIGSTSVSDNPSRKQTKTRAEVEVPLSGHGCTLHFDGASKGNPGVAGAGAVLRADDGSLICKLREGLGVATNNVAEYRAVILGLKYALTKGFTRIFVQGDSKLVCMQVQGLWQVKNQNMSNLYEEVKKLKNKFVSFKISHVLRELNSEADAQANLAITLSDGQVQEESGK